MSQQNLDVTELDFGQIKQNLINYFRNTPDSPFKDWNYEGSGLNTIIDLLAYNTHYNAMTAHMAINESFIDSAQLRSSVVSSAKLLGYLPKSSQAATASINLAFTRSPDSTATIYEVERGAQFSARIGDESYTFITTDSHNLPYDYDTGKFSKDIVITQGILKTNRFQTNNFSNNRYVIDDADIDTSSLAVRVYPSGTGSKAESFNQFTEIAGIDGESLIYFLNENALGKYEISFGNGMFGKKLNNLSVIEIEYISTVGETANGATDFYYVSSINSSASKSPTINVLLSGGATGGGARELIESIRTNAPISFAAQNRAVTADDYKAVIRNSGFKAQSISVWGGEDNDPPQYGNVYISIKPEGSALYLKNEDKLAILDALKYKKVLSIQPQIVDPEYVFLVLDVFFKYNKNLSNLALSELQSLVKNVVSTYSGTKLESFDGVFRQSELSKLIDSSNVSILNSLVRVYLSKAFIIDPINQQKYTLKFGAQISHENNRAIVNCTSWRTKGVQMYLGDEAIAGDSTTRNIYTYYNESGVETKVNREAGKLNLLTGVLTLDPIYADEYTTILVDLIPSSNDIAPKKNELLLIDMPRLSVTGEVDTIAVGGSSRATTYTTFNRDR